MSELRNKAWRRAETALEELHSDPKAKKLVMPTMLKHNLLSVISKAILESYEYRDSLWKEFAIEDVEADDGLVCGLCRGHGHVEVHGYVGAEPAVKKPCICPDGRAIKEVYGEHRESE